MLNNQVQNNLQEYLMHNKRKVMDWMKQINATAVNFSGISEDFCNINSPDDLWRKKEK